METSNRHRGGSRTLKANLLERRRHQGQGSVIKEVEARLKRPEERLEREMTTRVQQMTTRVQQMTTATQVNNESSESDAN